MILKSLRGKLIIVLFLLTTLTAVSLTAAAYYTYRENALRDRAARLLAWAQMAGELSMENLTPQEKESLMDFSQRAQARILLLDEEGIVQADSSSAEFYGRRFAHEEVRSTLDYGVTARGIHYLVDEGWVMYLTAPVLQEKEIQGVVFLSHAIDDLFAELRLFIWRLAALTAGIMVFVALLGGILAGKLVNPLEKMTQAVQMMAKGYLRQRLPVHGSDELAQLAKAFNEMSRELEKGDEELRTFVANASHEIRSPIGSLKVLIEALLARPDREAAFYYECLEEMNRETDRLTALVRDLLFLARLEDRKMEWRLETVNLSQVVREVAGQFYSAAKAKDLQLAVEVEKDLSMPGHPRLLERLVYNLLDNAVKYTKEGVVQVALRKEQRGIVLKVADTGEGIPQHLQPLVWQRFYRVDAARSREKGGTGLGLSLVRQIVELHKGDIALKSTEGKGTTVDVVLGYSKMN